jgi:hypothetical protein
MRVQHQRHGRAGALLALVTGLDTAGGAGKNNVRHGSRFSQPVFASEKLGFCAPRWRLKTLEFQVLAKQPTYACRILDQPSQELYIPDHGVPFGLLALSTPAGGAKSKEKRRFGIE